MRQPPHGAVFGRRLETEMSVRMAGFRYDPAIVPATGQCECYLGIGVAQRDTIDRMALAHQIPH